MNIEGDCVGHDLLEIHGYSINCLQYILDLLYLPEQGLKSVVEWQSGLIRWRFLRTNKERNPTSPPRSPGTITLASLMNGS